MSKIYAIQFSDDNDTQITVNSVRDAKHKSTKCISVWTERGQIDLTYNREGYLELIDKDLEMLESCFPWFQRSYRY